jgi:hypothetical protein
VPTEPEQALDRQETSRGFASYIRGGHETSPNDRRPNLPLSDILENTSTTEFQNFLPSPQELYSPAHNYSNSSNHERRCSDAVPLAISSINQPQAVTNFGRLSPPEYISGSEDAILCMEYQSGVKNTSGSTADNVDGHNQHQNGSIQSPVTEESV